MSPELVDEAILAHCKPQFLKVAKIIYYVANKLERSSEEAVYFISDRIKALVAAERLEAAGNLDWWTYSEVRLPNKKSSGAVAAARRRNETTDQGT
ncbi:MAG TPA: DUF3658 domain-containing protein [Bradyrhizobium sp.]|jgi:hypothetical protein|uniref:DUF3658 domain-containing protein n=1 Tax=Bradyrhizobium sp. TaxID=376 RepID=UPI002B48F09F|nr:DUF3658 domain-containing protein [Bradyrhizobium sp.]HKO71864.1 DUF3658 domain-containing protein [Bradyrhizobium sp.]